MRPSKALTTGLPVTGGWMLAALVEAGPWRAPLAQVSAAVPATRAATSATTVSPANGRRRPWRPLALVTEISPTRRPRPARIGLNGQKKALTR